jgi:hypothetical protein
VGTNFRITACYESKITQRLSLMPIPSQDRSITLASMILYVEFEVAAFPHRYAPGTQLSDYLGLGCIRIWFRRWWGTYIFKVVYISLSLSLFGQKDTIGSSSRYWYSITFTKLSQVRLREREIAKHCWQRRWIEPDSGISCLFKADMRYRLIRSLKSNQARNLCGICWCD